ncbi:MAG: VWA domain-containing protein [Candidatus Zixiibacteriota bacterium]
MKFADTDALYLLIGCVLALALYWWGIGRKKRALESFGSLGLVLRGREQVSYGRQAGKGAMVVLALTLFALSSARFQCGTHLEAVKREGIDLIIAVDVSRSMLAEDLRPNRLARATQEVRGIIDSLRGDRIGLVAFAGNAFVQCPLTLDYAAAAIFLEAFDTDLLAQQGTAIGEAIRVATSAFESSEKSHKALLLLTDGEDHDTDPLGAAEEAAEQGVRIYPIGIGSAQGEPIPAYDQSGAHTGFVKDENEQVVVSRLDETVLREIARKTGGAYFRATPGGIELEKVMAEVRQIETKELEGKLVTQYEDRYQWPLLLGLLLLMMEFILPERPGSLWRRLSGADTVKHDQGATVA